MSNTVNGNRVVSGIRIDIDISHGGKGFITHL